MVIWRKITAGDVIVCCFASSLPDGPPGPILEFMGSLQHVQKRHPTLVAQVDLILQN